MSKKERTRSLNKLSTMSWESPIFKHGSGKYQNHVFDDNIPGYPGYYISKRGVLYSRWDINGKGVLKKRYHKKVPHLNKNGRYIIGLSQPGLGTTKWLIHRLVALAFLSNPNNYPQVNHKDEDKKNNCVENLEWCDAKYNVNYGTRNKRAAEKHSIPVYCFELDKTFYGAMEAGRELGIDNSSISKCCKGQLKTAGGYHWRFKTGGDSIASD